MSVSLLLAKNQSLICGDSADDEQRFVEAVLNPDLSQSTPEFKQQLEDLKKMVAKQPKRLVSIDEDFEWIEEEDYSKQ